MVLVRLVQTGGGVTELVIVVINPSAELHHSHVVVEVGVGVQGVLVHLLDLHQRPVGSPVSKQQLDVRSQTRDLWESFNLT